MFDVLACTGIVVDVVVGDDGQLVVVDWSVECCCAMDMCDNGLDAQSVAEFRNLWDLEANGFCKKVHLSAFEEREFGGALLFAQLVTRTQPAVCVCSCGSGWCHL